jgi:hypothetical protein
MIKPYSNGITRRGRLNEARALKGSADFQTGLERVDVWVAVLQPRDTLSRFGNRRSAEDSGMRALFEGAARTV